MSDRRWGIKPYPVKEYTHYDPIRGKAVFTDGTDCGFTYSRNTTDGVRELDHFEADGRLFLPEVPREEVTERERSGEEDGDTAKLPLQEVQAELPHQTLCEQVGEVHASEVLPELRQGGSR